MAYFKGKIIEISNKQPTDYISGKTECAAEDATWTLFSYIRNVNVVSKLTAFSLSYKFHFNLSESDTAIVIRAVLCGITSCSPL
jgi:hypothetical protein